MGQNRGREWEPHSETEAGAKTEIEAKSETERERERERGRHSKDETSRWETCPCQTGPN